MMKNNGKQSKTFESDGDSSSPEELSKHYERELRKGIQILTNILAQTIQDTPQEWVLPKGVKPLQGENRLHQIKYYLS